jgi:hypothetical protein
MPASRDIRKVVRQDEPALRSTCPVCGRSTRPAATGLVSAPKRKRRPPLYCSRRCARKARLERLWARKFGAGRGTATASGNSGNSPTKSTAQNRALAPVELLGGGQLPNPRRIDPQLLALIRRVELHRFRYGH